MFRKEIPDWSRPAIMNCTMFMLLRSCLPLTICLQLDLHNTWLHTMLFLLQGVQGISDIITIPGLVNVDFADVKSIMCNSGTAMLGVGVSTGKNRAEEAAMVTIFNTLADWNPPQLLRTTCRQAWCYSLKLASMYF